MMRTQSQALLQLTLSNPRQAARALIGLNVPAGSAWTALLLVSVVSAILGYLSFVLSSAASDPQLQALFGSPWRTAMVQVGMQGLTALLVFGVGRQFGGQGSLANALVLTAWVEVPLILLQLVQLVAVGLVPPVAELIGFVGLGLYLVILPNFVAELHGFRSALVVFVGLIGVSIVTALVLVTLAAAVLGGLPNV